MVGVGEAEVAVVVEPLNAPCENDSRLGYLPFCHRGGMASDDLRSVNCPCYGDSYGVLPHYPRYCLHGDPMPHPQGPAVGPGWDGHLNAFCVLDQVEGVVDFYCK